MDQNLDLFPDFSRARIAWSDLIQVGALALPAERIVALLGDHLTDERRARLDEVVAKRSLHLVPVLENIYDKGNVSAVMRSAEAFGFHADVSGRRAWREVQSRQPGYSRRGEMARREVLFAPGRGGHGP
ncbi:MAG: RNA methyltransferase [Calothrix sp. SM1_5_4]|nr:RNA methyltransferase [Calothrix sp. SM1_5_4]